MVETGKLVSQASREFLGGLDQWEPRETRDQWETRDLRDLQECPDLLAPGEILGKMAPLDSPGLQASLDQQEREGWLAPRLQGIPGNAGAAGEKRRAGQGWGRGYAGTSRHDGQ